MASARNLLAVGTATPLRHALGARSVFAFFLTLLLSLAMATAHAAPEAPGTPAAPVLVLTVQDAIGPASATYVQRGLDQAQRSGAKLVVIALDTPGGLDTSMRQIIQAILASPVPVAVYVQPQGARAASAGTYILYAAQIAAMAPATTVGAATPVLIGLLGPVREPPPAAGNGQDAAKAPDTMQAKRVNDAAAFIRGLAQLRGRNADWAEHAVRDAATLTAAEALQDHVIDVIAKDIPDLLNQIDGRTVHAQSRAVTLATRGLAFDIQPPDARQRFMAWITEPGVALVLLIIGIYGLIFEFSSPSFGVAGGVGAVCLLLALFALQSLPVNYVGLALIVLGFVLLVAELLSPSFGALGAGGVVAFIAGGLLLFDRDQPGWGVPLPLVLVLAATSAAVILLGCGMALKARRQPLRGGRDGFAGLSGEVLEVSDGEIWAQVKGERWRVRSQQPLASGQRIRVLAVHGLTLEVQPDTDAPHHQGATP